MWFQSTKKYSKIKTTKYMFRLLSLQKLKETSLDAACEFFTRRLISNGKISD